MKRSSLPLLVLLFSLCAIIPMTIASAKDAPALDQRVTAYMNALIAKNQEALYEFQDANYRKTVSKEAFLGRAGNVDIKEFRIDAVTMAEDGNSAEVNMKWVIQFQGYTFKDAPKKQQWVLENGEWFLKEKTEVSTPFGPLPNQPLKKNP